MKHEDIEDLRTSFNQMKDMVNMMHITLFGREGKDGLVQRIDAILKVADGIKWVLTKIFIAICVAIGIAIMPSILVWLSTAIKHGG